MRIVDLSQEISETMAYNPVHFAPRFEPYATTAEHGWAATAVTMSSHLGTHLDAPCHFIPGAAAVTDIPLSDLVGQATVVHVAPGVTDIGVADLPERPTARLLLDTGHDAAGAPPGRPYPVLTTAAAVALVERGVKLLGVDCPSVDRDPAPTVHRILLGHGVSIVENLCRLADLPDRVDVCILPLPLRGLDGSPVRAIALIDDPTITPDDPDPHHR